MDPDDLTDRLTLPDRCLTHALSDVSAENPRVSAGF
jgi:hypothetical protein